MGQMQPCWLCQKGRFRELNNLFDTSSRLSCWVYSLPWCYSLGYWQSFYWGYQPSWQRQASRAWLPSQQPSSWEVLEFLSAKYFLSALVDFFFGPLALLVVVGEHLAIFTGLQGAGIIARGAIVGLASATGLQVPVMGCHQQGLHLQF